MAKKKKQTGRKASTLGASYRAASSGIILATPALVAAQAGARTPEAFIDAYRNDAKNFMLGVAVHTLDNAIGQKVLGHNTALGRGSITAIAAEAIPVVLGSRAGLGQGGGAGGWGTEEYTAAKTGYKARGPFGLYDVTKLYLGTKYGLGVVRKASSMSLFKPVFKGVKKMLGSAGGAF